MRRSLRLIIPSLLATGLLPGLAEGQLVEVGRGYVRAPFVRVQRRGGQRARVRAPFVDVGSRPTTASPYVAPMQEPTPAPPAEPVPTAVVPQGETTLDVTQMDAALLERTIRVGEAELDRQLNQMPAGDHWRRSLYVGSLGDLLGEEDSTLPTEAKLEQLQQILDAYHQALISPASRSVTQLEGFQTVQPALRELLLSPEERQRGRLAAAARDLEVQLGTMQNGAVWADHLRLPDTFQLGAGVAPTNRDELTSLLSRFDAAASNPRNRPVTDLPTFQAMHQDLHDYVEQLARPSVPAAEAVSADEPMIIRQRSNRTPTAAVETSPR